MTNNELKLLMYYFQHEKNNKRFVTKRKLLVFLFYFKIEIKMPIIIRDITGLKYLQLAVDNLINLLINTKTIQEEYIEIGDRGHFKAYILSKKVNLDEPAIVNKIINFCKIQKEIKDLI